jgi:hypothetical protein
VDLSQETLDPDNEGEASCAAPTTMRWSEMAFAASIPLPKAATTSAPSRRLVSSGSAVCVREAVLADPQTMMEQTSFTVPLDDVADLYFKDLISDERRVVPTGIASPTGTEGTIQVLSTANDFRDLLADVKEFLSEEADGVERELGSKSARWSAPFST